jgi:hypothetical protein
MQSISGFRKRTNGGIARNQSVAEPHDRRHDFAEGCRIVFPERMTARRSKEDAAHLGRDQNHHSLAERTQQ